MKASTRTNLECIGGKVFAEFTAEGFLEHGCLPGVVDLAECLDQLRLDEKGILGEDGHRTPVTILAFGYSPVSLEGVVSYMKTEVAGPFHAAWTAGPDKLEFVVAATQIKGIKALRGIYKAALDGRAIVGRSRDNFGAGLMINAVEDKARFSDADVRQCHP